MNKKDEEVQVDEDMIRSMMMREVPVYQDRDSDQPETKPEVAKGIGQRKKKEPSGSYAERFLTNDMCRNRVTVNISRELFAKLRKILPVIAPEVTLTSYVNNIISEHLNQYRDEIMEIYQSETEKQF